MKPAPNETRPSPAVVARVEPAAAERRSGEGHSFPVSDYTLPCQLVNGIVRPVPWGGPVLPESLLEVARRARAKINKDEVLAIQVLDWVLQHSKDDNDGV